MWRELRLAVRRLWRRPGFTALAVVILALGLGASVTMFSLVNALVLRALPYPEAERLVFLFGAADGKRAGTAHSLAAFREYQRQDQVFESVAAFRWREPVLEQPGQTPASLWGLDVTADFLRVLRVEPRLGRGFLPGEDRPGGQRVAIISTRFWQDRLGGDPGIIGRQIRLDGEVHTVVGVMSPEFQNTPPPVGAGGRLAAVFALTSGRCARAGGRRRPVARQRHRPPAAGGHAGRGGCPIARAAGAGGACRGEAGRPAPAAGRTRVGQYRPRRLAGPGAGGAGAVRRLREPDRACSWRGWPAAVTTGPSAWPSVPAGGAWCARRWPRAC